MAEMGREILSNLLSSGLDPSEVAARVLDAIKEERFYILTHQRIKGAIEARMQDILGERTPRNPMGL